MTKEEVALYGYNVSITGTPIWEKSEKYQAKVRKQCLAENFDYYLMHGVRNQLWTFLKDEEVEYQLQPDNIDKDGLWTILDFITEKKCFKIKAIGFDSFIFMIIVNRGKWYEITLNFEGVKALVHQLYNMSLKDFNKYLKDLDK